MTLTLAIFTPEGKVLEQTADTVVVPGVQGFFGVLPRHAPLVSAIGTGILKFSSGGTENFCVLSDGVAEVRPDGVTLLVDTAQRANNAADAEGKLLALLADRSRLSVSTPPAN